MPDQYAKMNKTLLNTRIEDKMLHYITCECKPGDKLPNEFDLARRFETSRSTIREVMKAIAGLGMVEIRHGSGTYVLASRPVKSDPLHLAGRKDTYRLALELFDVRLMLEPEIAAKAAELRTQDQAEEVVRYCDEVERLYRSGADHTDMDIEFHSYIAKCSCNMVVQTLIPIIQSAISTFCNVTERKLMHETIVTHRSIANSIFYKDPVGARCAMTSHLAVNRDMILENLRRKKDV